MPFAACVGFRRRELARGFACRNNTGPSLKSISVRKSSLHGLRTSKIFLDHTTWTKYRPMRLNQKYLTYSNRFYVHITPLKPHPQIFSGWAISSLLRFFLKFDSSFEKVVNPIFDLYSSFTFLGLGRYGNVPISARTTHSIMGTGKSRTALESMLATK